MQPNQFPTWRPQSSSLQSNEPATGNRGMKRPNSGVLKYPPISPVMPGIAMQQALDSVCSELACAIEHPGLFALLADPFRHQLMQLLASGRVSLVTPHNNSIGTEPRWFVITPILPGELATLVRLGTLLIDAKAPAAAAAYGVALLMNLVNAGLAEADKELVRQQLVRATLDRLASATGLLSSLQWLPVLCDALSHRIPLPTDRAACEAILKFWLEAWRDDKEMRVEPCLVLEELRRVLVAQVDVHRSENDDATLVFFVEELFKGALKRKASAEAEWALRVLQQWTGHAAQQVFVRCAPQMPISEELRNIDLNPPLTFAKSSPELFLKLLRLANFPLRTHHLLRVAKLQGQEGPPVLRLGPSEGDSPTRIVPAPFFHDLALLLLREAVELLRAPLPSLDDAVALVQAGLAYLLRSETLARMNTQAPRHLKDLMPMLVGVLERLPDSAIASLHVQLMCLELLGRWQAGALRLEPTQVLRISRCLDVSEWRPYPPSSRGRS